MVEGKIALPEKAEREVAGETMAGAKVTQWYQLKQDFLIHERIMMCWWLMAYLFLLCCVLKTLLQNWQQKDFFFFLTSFFFSLSLSFLSFSFPFSLFSSHDFLTSSHFTTPHNTHHHHSLHLYPPSCGLLFGYVTHVCLFVFMWLFIFFLSFFIIIIMYCKHILFVYFVVKTPRYAEMHLV